MEKGRERDGGVYSAAGEDNNSPGGLLISLIDQLMGYLRKIDCERM
jgi:hypothetical protein